MTHAHTHDSNSTPGSGNRRSLSLDEAEANFPLLTHDSESAAGHPHARFPSGIRGLWHRFLLFLDGPHPRKPPKEHVYFSRAQSRLDGTFHNWTARRVILIWTAFYAIWSITAGFLIHRSSFAAASLSSPSSDPPAFLSCVSTLWQRNNFCGLDGRDCEPMNGTSFDFRCPANCLSETLLNERIIGNHVVNHRPLVIGGQGEGEYESGIYRADSFICAAAIHAGLLSDAVGGCGRLSVRGGQDSFEGSIGHGVESLPFASQFPKSFSFTKLEKFGGCEDLRWLITVVNVVFSSIHSLLQTSPIWYYYVLFVTTYFHVALVSDPPPRTGTELLSAAFKGFLPSLFVGYSFWVTAVRWTLAKAPPLDRTLFWLGGLWFGALLNYISAHIPVSRLLWSDITRDGGVFYVVAVFILVVAIMIGQMNVMRKAGDLVYYLKIYLTGLFVLIVLGLIPGLTFRLHHYIFGLLLVPGTAYPTRLSMLYQGILIGLFIDGIARWGFDSILETAAHLRDDGALNSALPSFAAEENWLARGGISWSGELPAAHQYSVLINDVERYRGLGHRLDPRTTGLQLVGDVPYYIRVAFAYGSNALDYSKPATFFLNGTLSL